MITLERASHNSPIGWKSLVGVLIVPLIVALGFLGATWNADHRLHRAQAAVVNLDEMVELNGQPVPLGRQLAAGLVERRDDNLSWELADAAHAKSGLESGRYVAVITIPKEFSADATSFAANDGNARQATIKVETSQVTGIADGAIAQVIAETARGVFNTELTETYLDNIYLGFNETGKQFRTVADASGKLADGGDQLADGMRSSADGTAELAAGSRAYATGVAEAATGAGQLATGAETLAAGGGQLKTGADGLADGAGQLADGAGQLAGGVGQLSAGMGQLADGSAQLADGSQQLADGTAQLAPGVRAYVAGVDQLVGGIEPVLGLLEGIDTSQLDPAQLQAAADSLSTMQAQAVTQAQRLEAMANAPCPTPQGVEFTPEQRAAFCDEWERMTASLTTATPQTGGKSPVQWANEIAASPELTQGITTLQTFLPQLPQLVDGAGQIGQLRPAGAQIVAGVDGVAEGTAQLNTGIQAFNTGVGEAAAGVPLLADGANQLAGGSRTLADGAGQFATGVGQYTDGVSQIASGTRGLATGMNSLADGADNLATGTEDLADGLDLAADGGRELADGQRQLADGLAEGATKVPTYSDADREALKTAVAQPIAAGDQVSGLIPAASSTSLLMVLALWLGGLATYLVIQAISSRTLTSTRSTFDLVRRALVPGLGIAAVQAIALTILGQVVLGLSAPKVLGVLAMLLLGGAMFVVVNHALVSWFGGFGRLVSVTMVTLAAAGGLLSALPAFFDVALPMLPLTPVLHGIRAIITDGSGVTGAVAMTVLWLIVGLAASIGAVLRRRTVSPQRFARLVPRSAPA